MRSITGAELRENVGDSALDGCLRDKEAICDLFVGIPSCNQSQNINFALAQGFVRGVFRKLAGNLRRDYLSPLMDGMNRLDKSPIVSFQQVGPRAGTQSAHYLNIAMIGVSTMMRPSGNSLKIRFVVSIPFNPGI